MSSAGFQFKKRVSKVNLPQSPEELFLDLRKRDPTIEHLWSHQADILRSYESHINSKDIAIELPTGSGKTLVGLLIGQYRRIVKKERILYLCPTKQLVHQVYEKSKQYDIRAHPFIGKQNDYSPEDFNQYLNGEAIAIATYSSLFNTNPRFNDPNIIICDDAHGAEQYIASMWSLNIDRFDNYGIFWKIFSLFEDILPIEFCDIIHNSNPTSSRKMIVEKVPTPSFVDRLDQLRSCLDENIKPEIRNLFYPMSIIRENLIACNMFISWSEILIRPWIPPSLTHSPFNSATQRIYMSATLGEGGELERIIGVPKIERIPVPVGWDKRGSGRRFFVFPDYKYRWNEYIGFVAEQIKKQNRTLILCPDRVTAEVVKTYLQSFDITHRFLNSHDIEDSLESFTSNNETILLLTNRYDGIDLPGDTCRQLIIVGSLGSTNLHEQFLLTRLGLTFLLKDRIRTRFTQATGRCTRGATDYSVVMPLGSDLFEYCSRLENRKEMHPELQAEIIFSLDQMKDLELDKFSIPIEMFLNQTEEWKNAEEYITEERDSIKVTKDKRTEILNSVVKNEVNFQYSLWNKDFQNSLGHARKIVDELSGDQFEGYRALWCYVVGSIGWILNKKLNDASYIKISKDFYMRSKNCSKTISWFSELPLLLESQEIEIPDLISGYAVEAIQRALINYGSTGPRFEKTINTFEEQIKSDEYRRFELGLTHLGEILGFNANRPEGKGVPDSVWQISNKLIILFEAKSEEKETNSIPIRTCREASGHYNWAKTNLSSYNDAKKICMVVSRKNKLDTDAIPHAENLYYIHIDRIREIFDEISGILRRIRSFSAEFNEDSVRPKIIRELQEKKLDPMSLVGEFESIPLLKLNDQIL